MKLQDTSLDIWDKKYRLKDKNGKAVDKTIEDTYKRVARALSNVETEDKEYWYKEFLKALQNGAIPAGRITSNAGAKEHKPGTSLINCVVSDTVPDSMTGILEKVHEAGVALAAGSGIGYEFSTLRPRGAHVAGAGASTSGPLSFMDIYDSMCFTISSAGGRRGAQMATFDIHHPDVLEFIKAKREDGNLRQFNMSLLITKEFMQAVKDDKEWKLSFPVTRKEGIPLSETDDFVYREWPETKEYIVDGKGLAACKVYRTLPAREIWDAIMKSTYDYAEPGFILIDKVNEMNNNWFCENIRATNPCVSGDTRLATQHGLIPIKELQERETPLKTTVDNRVLTGIPNDYGTQVRPAVRAFITEKNAEIFKVITKEGFEIKGTAWHGFHTNEGDRELKELRKGHKLLIQSGEGQFGTQGSRGIGFLLGAITADGRITHKRNGWTVVVASFWGDEEMFIPEILNTVNSLTFRKVSAVSVYRKGVYFNKTITSISLARVLKERYGFTKETKLQVPEVVWRGTRECVIGYIQALFEFDGTLNVTENSGCSIRLSASHRPLLVEVQQLLINLGIFSRIYLRRKAGKRKLPDGKGGLKEYPTRAEYDLVISAANREAYLSVVGFRSATKQAKYNEWAATQNLRNMREVSFLATVDSIVQVENETSYDTTQKDKNSIIFNGIATKNCGEQPLPPHGACLLGSINLTKFVREPFTDSAFFDWTAFHKTVSVFTRMLDNVVELNNLPLPQQRDEIERKRRHGMGYLGLGSALIMLGKRYGSEEACEVTGRITRALVLSGWRTGVTLAKEKGPAPIFDEEFIVTSEMVAKRPEMLTDGIVVGDKIPGRVLLGKYSRYMQKLAKQYPEIVNDVIKYGARFTHHSSIAPTGTISLSLGNNASNGIEPSFAHQYSRNVIREGKKTKEKVEVFSYEALVYRRMHGQGCELPENFLSADGISPKEHIDIQAAAQEWIDSSISKTINVPTDCDYETFKDLYIYAYDKGLKGATTFRFNPEAFQGVLVKEKDLKATTYQFTLDDGSTVDLKGDEEIDYEGETHTAANLYDALKEGYYGKF